QAGQAQPGHAEAADAQEVAARQAVAQPGTGTAEAEHGGLPLGGWPGQGVRTPRAGPRTVGMASPFTDTRPPGRSPRVSGRLRGAARPAGGAFPPGTGPGTPT